MPIKKKKLVRKSNVSPALAAIKKQLKELETLKEKNNSANNAVNRHKTKIKTTIHAYLKENGANANDGIVIDGIEIAHRPNITDEIDPQTWYQWFLDKKITRNQFFKSLSVSVTAARDSIGNDQLDQVKHTTLSKTPDLRIGKETLVDAPEGAIVPFAGNNIKTAKQAKQVEADQSGKPVIAASALKQRRRRIRI